MRAPQVRAICLAVWMVGAAHPAAALSLSFREGEAGYTGAEDTFLQNNLGSGAALAALTVQRGDGQFSTKNALFLFDDIIGADPGQIPVGSTIVSATFTVTTTSTPDADSGALDLHRMQMAWDPADGNLAYGMAPWNAQPWIQADDFEAAATATATVTPAALGTAYAMDVTADVQAWIDGAPNHGWVLLADPATAADDFAFLHSAEAPSTGLRPLLTVELVPEPGLAGLTLLALAAAALTRRRGRP